ncbi:MAG: hypothetical protein IH614_10040 [Desulfuromonadales bacterium]|nr:hypothetical protein [Desulfuromonadales bacterium]
MKNWLLMGALLVLSAGAATADTLQLSFNDRSAQLGYRYFLMEDDFGSTVLGGRLLYNEKEETTLGSLGVEFIGEPGNIAGLDLGFGARLYGGRADHRQELLVLTIGTTADYFPPMLGGLGVFGEIFYGPKIFSTLDAERLLETSVAIGYAATPRVRVHLGYQNIRTKFEDTGTWTIDEALRIGFTARF